MKHISLWSRPKWGTCDAKVLERNRNYDRVLDRLKRCDNVRPQRTAVRSDLEFLADLDL
jgi:hypothetical protein